MSLVLGISIIQRSRCEPNRRLKCSSWRWAQSQLQYWNISKLSHCVSECVGDWRNIGSTSWLRFTSSVRFTGQALKDAELYYRDAEKEVLALLRVLKNFFMCSEGEASEFIIDILEWGGFICPNAAVRSRAITMEDRDSSNQKNEWALTGLLGVGWTAMASEKGIDKAMVIGDSRIATQQRDNPMSYAELASSIISS